MNKNIGNVELTVKANLCLGCGLCEDICPVSATTIVIENGEYRPVVDGRKCLGDRCGKCSKICPGLGIEIGCINQEVHSGCDIKEDEYIGRYVQLYSGHCTDEDIRYHSASGGMITGLLVWMLEKGLIEGAVVTRFSKKDRLTPETFVACNKEELLSAKSSKYCPVSMRGIRKQIREAYGKYVIVGLPCHIQGFRKIEKIDKTFKEHVFAYWGIYCSSGRTFNLTDYVLSRRGIDKKKIKYFAYRDNGCLGNLVVEGTNQNEQTYKYEEGFGAYYCTLRSFFIPNRCQFCIDHFSELADISFGDLHVKPFSDDTIGTSSIVARNRSMNGLLLQASRDGVVEIKELAKETLNASQQMAKTKKHKYFSHIWLVKKIGLKTPEYDVEYKRLGIVKTILSFASINSQRFLGRHRSLWWIIDMLKSKSENG